MKILVFILGLILIGVESVKIKSQYEIIKQKHHHSIYKLLYVLKKGDSIQVSQLGVKNLDIEPFDSWVAKGFFDGENYNYTGLEFSQQT